MPDGSDGGAGSTDRFCAEGQRPKVSMDIPAANVQRCDLLQLPQVDLADESLRFRLDGDAVCRNQRGEFELGDHLYRVGSRLGFRIPSKVYLLCNRYRNTPQSPVRLLNAARGSPCCRRLCPCQVWCFEEDE